MTVVAETSQFVICDLVANIATGNLGANKGNRTEYLNNRQPQPSTWLSSKTPPRFLSSLFKMVQILPLSDDLFNKTNSRDSCQFTSRDRPLIGRSRSKR